MTIVIRLAEARDVQAASIALGAAFDGNPWTSWTVAAQHHRERIEALQALVIEHIAIPSDACWVAEQAGDGSIVGASVWIRPDVQPDQAAWMAIADRTAALEGDRHVASIAAAEMTQHLQPAEPHVYLGAVGTLPLMRRQRIGRDLIQPGLDLAHRLGVDTFLETSTTENVRWYETLGFTTTGHVTIPAGPDVWTMSRSAGV